MYKPEFILYFAIILDHVYMILHLDKILLDHWMDFNVGGWGLDQGGPIKVWGRSKNLNLRGLLGFG